MVTTVLLLYCGWKFLVWVIYKLALVVCIVVGSCDGCGIENVPAMLRENLADLMML